MQKKGWVWFILFILVSSLLFTVSCTKAVKEEPAAVTDTDAEAVAAQEAQKTRMDEEARLKALEEQRLKDEEARLKAEEQARLKLEAQEEFTKEDIYFDFDSSAILPTAEEVMQKKAEWLKNNSGVSVVIEGHCDERGTNEYNLALGDRRASAAKTYMVNLGIDEAQLKTISYGEERPEDVEHSEEAWAKNRRAHFIVE